MENFLYEYHFLNSLLLSVIVEFGVIFSLLKYFFKEHYKFQDLFFAGVFPSVATLPYVWFIFPLLFMHERGTYIWFSEISVTAIETYLIYMILKTRWMQSFFLSVVANMSSFFMGWLFWSYIR